MKVFLLCLLLLVMTSEFSRAEDGFIDVTAPAGGKLRLSIDAATPISGPSAPELGRELRELFTFDLGLTGLFNVSAPAAGTSGADLVLKTAYALKGTELTLECRIFDAVLNRELTGKRYTGPRKDLRRMGHAFSDEVLRARTGEKGAFTGKIAFVTKLSGNKEISVMDYDGRNVQRVTNNGSINLNPDFAPSGREIIYTSYQKGNPDLYRRELLTGSEARISARPGLNAMGAIAPDDSRTALVLTKDGNSEIYLISREGKELARLTRNPAIDVSPAWSPDGSKLAFVSDRLGKPQIFNMNADGTNVKRLTLNGAYNVSPRWSPNNDRIIYARKGGNGFQLFAINPDGSHDVQLTTRGSNEHPRWSPDGRFIVFSSTRDGGQAIYLMRADGSGQTRVSRGKSVDTHPVWSLAG